MESDGPDAFRRKLFQGHARFDKNAFRDDLKFFITSIASIYPCFSFLQFLPIGSKATTVPTALAVHGFARPLLRCCAPRVPVLSLHQFSTALAYAVSHFGIFMTQTRGYVVRVLLPLIDPKSIEAREVNWMFAPILLIAGV